MEGTLCTFSCPSCGRDGFEVVDRNPPIPMDVVSIYDKDNEGESCEECPNCEHAFPSFALYRRKPKRVYGRRLVEGA